MDIRNTNNDNSSNILRTKMIGEEIKFWRLEGNLTTAINICEKAIIEFPKDYFFAKILSDLYFQEKKYKEAFAALVDFLVKIPPVSKLVDQFAKRYFQFRRVLPTSEMSKLADQLVNTIENSAIDDSLLKNIRPIISRDISKSQLLELDENETKFVALFNDDSNFNDLVRIEKIIEAKGEDRLITLLDGAINNHSLCQKSYRNRFYFVSIYEKFKKYDSALKIVIQLLEIKLDPIVVRSLFRICRNLKRYDEVDELLAKEPSLVKTHDFNILYELVYYFEAKNDLENVHRILRTIDKSFAQNAPVLRTLRNFYIRFGMLDEAKKLEPTITQLYKSKDGIAGKYSDNLAESETELASKVQDLYSQLEHQKQLAAISDLTTGISHELGQPITNIRYTIQFYKRMFQKNLTQEGVSKVLDSILEETERMGGLVNRLSPLTSSRSVNEKFDVVERIRKRFQLENPRLIEGRIKTRISPNTPIFIIGDPVKFDQLVSNLLLNAIDAITERKFKRENLIKVLIENSTNEIRIIFTDTGVGIPIKYRNKIFDPFFSTKAPGKGEGLGLFIVWNLLKMLGGRISVDTQYNVGARIIITIPKNSTLKEN